MIMSLLIISCTCLQYGYVSVREKLEEKSYLTKIFDLFKMTLYMHIYIYIYILEDYDFHMKQNNIFWCIQ